MSSNTAQSGQSVATPRESTRADRYVQLALLVLAAGAIYPILYLRQVYQPTMLEVFHITEAQLGYLYSALGTIFLVCYLPSGWLADRIAPRVLISFSLIATGALGLWYSTAPSFGSLIVIFGCWGLTTGLTFWAAIIKRVSMIAAADEQGRFFGFLDGGRGLVEALLATVAISLFAWVTQTRGESTAAGFRLVVYLYAFLCIGLGVVLGLVRDPAAAEAKETKRRDSNVMRDLAVLLKNPQLWLLAGIVFCGYQVFWATYSFSAYLHEKEIGLSVVAAGFITTLKLWMRPIGGIGGGFLGDRFSKTSVLVFALFAAAAALLVLMAAPSIGNHTLVAAIVLFIGVMTYAIRGLYWSLLDQCKVPAETTGLAIGLVSVIGYSPDAVLPLINGYLTQNYPGVHGYQLYFGYIACMSALGGVAGLVFKHRLDKQESQR
ncbi:MFS transporter [Caballeronia ptereochthonis]|uniref:Major facilitator transporter n=1 Tax=Caballeronia ptereochthonis TaxID=1777144 RepID=A0A157ZDF1_9BURK|nr:MFS transporter [Caballeronia ptereochthonis]SAK43544.1 major facilitator transporter [Caballeronia ptereochthonis]